MAQYLGINDRTGQKMFLTEDLRVVREVSRCVCCGAENVPAHYLHSDKCEACGKAWQNYKVSKGRINIRSSEKSINTYYQKILYWCNKAQQGFEAPPDIWQQRQIIEQYLSFIASAKQAVPKKTITCKRCGGTATVPVGSDEVCNHCSDRYLRYKRLSAKMNVLTIEECEELHQIIRDYIADYKRGGWCPNTDLILSKLRRRKHALGCD